MNRQTGFTLVELMVTLAVAAILLTVGIPNMSDFIKNNRIISQANLFVASANLARSEAIKRRRDATICVSTSYNAATPTCTGGTNWATGWVVWVDDDSDSAIDATEVLRVVEPFPADTTFTAAAKDSFEYNAGGTVDGADTLTLCDNRTGERGRRVRVSAGGRVNIDNVNCP